MADSQYYIPVMVEVSAAMPEHQPVVANLFELYAHDMSEFMDLELGADGRYGYIHLSAYWKEPDRYPFLIKVRGDLAGFALVCRQSQSSNDDCVMDVAEFFVIRGFRRLGVGTGAACDIWKKFPGKWKVRVRGQNGPAKAFWAQAVEAFTGKAVYPVPAQINGELWQAFTFES
ncbi:MAG: GNAT family N-acetyltransferase [Deltaproteobacteria bacterium]|nr:GNAT family N-acetyltransferase [Deltaproteobacteria bacterium]